MPITFPASQHQPFGQ